MEPTKDQKSKTFTQEQKRYLYNVVSEESRKEYCRIYDNFKSYITDLINTKLLTKDEIFMRTRPYVKMTSYIEICPEDFGMEDKISRPSEPDVFKNLKLSFSIDSKVPSFQDPTKKYTSIKAFCASERIAKLCSPEEINFICDALREVAIKKLEWDRFGIDTGWIRTKHSYRYFPEISTWGKLYKYSPEYFNILVEKYYTEPKAKEQDEYDLLRDLISVISR